MGVPVPETTALIVGGGGERVDRRLSSPFDHRSPNQLGSFDVCRGEAFGCDPACLQPASVGLQRKKTQGRFVPAQDGNGLLHHICTQKRTNALLPSCSAIWPLVNRWSRPPYHLLHTRGPAPRPPKHTPANRRKSEAMCCKTALFVDIFILVFPTTLPGLLCAFQKKSSYNYTANH